MAAASTCKTLATELSLLPFLTILLVLTKSVHFRQCVPDIHVLNTNILVFLSTQDTHARWNKPTATSGAVWDDSCKCFRSQDFGWSTFISHSHLHRRNFLKNNDLIVTADFSGKDLKCDAPFHFSI